MYDEFGINRLQWSQGVKWDSLGASVENLTKIVFSIYDSWDGDGNINWEQIGENQLRFSWEFSFMDFIL